MATMCKECELRPSKVHYTEIVNDKMVSMDLCLECAETKGIDVEKSSSYGLGDLVAGLIDTTTKEETGSVGKLQCTTCGYRYSNFKKVGRFGCPDCYRAFSKQLTPLLRQLHGSTRHDGKKPSAVGERALMRKELTDLKEKLARAIRNEQYETAAELRDRIRDLEAQVEER